MLLDVALLLRLVRALGLRALNPSDANAVHVAYVSLEVDLLFRLVLAPKLSASMPSYADAVHVGSVLLDVALLLRLELAVGLRAVVPSYANVVCLGLCAARSCPSASPCTSNQAQGSDATQCRCCESRPCASAGGPYTSSCTHTRQPRTSSTSLPRSINPGTSSSCLGVT